MPEHLQSPIPSHACSLREDAIRPLSRSPHPYHRQYFELPHSSERFNRSLAPTQSPLRSAQNTDDEDRASSGTSPKGYQASTNSDSGTEADDEHFLKGLPAPKLRPHKGLRGIDGTPSPLLSPAIWEEDGQSTPRKLRRIAASIQEQDGDGLRKARERLRQKRRIEIIRRITETVLLGSVGGVVCLNETVQPVLQFWKKELLCQSLIISALITLYPIRVWHHWGLGKSWRTTLSLAIPAILDPAPLLYPSAITMLVASSLSTSDYSIVLPSIVLAISSLPKRLIPANGSIESCNMLHWALSVVPILVSEASDTSRALLKPKTTNALDAEILLLIQPLHQALCTNLNHLTTTSLLPAELQLLSIASIDLLLLASSPQAVILKALLWIGGVGILVSCGHVLRWGVALARVPKWRFKRSNVSMKPPPKFNQKAFIYEHLGITSLKCPKDEVESDTSEDDVPPHAGLSFPKSPIEKSDTQDTRMPEGDRKLDDSPPMQRPRRHTLPVSPSAPRSSKTTPSGRRKRSTSSSIQPFLTLTYSQATHRKWIYAGYVYLCIAFIILAGIRMYVGYYALEGNEPIGWALGYMLGDLPRFRMEVVTANLQRWICLPSRTGLEHDESCQLGWVQHLRHAAIGEANTRLVLSAYWLAIIVVGLAIVFRLSSIYKVDTRRKVFHFMIVAMLLPATYVDPTFAALALTLMLAIFLLLDIFRASQLPPLSKHLAYFLTPYVDGRDLKGPVVISHIFLLIGCAIPLWLTLGSLPRTGSGPLSGWEVPIREVSMVSGVICVGLGDAAASLIGRRFGRHKWFWSGGKSIEGSVAFTTAVGLALGLAKAWLIIGGWPANNEDTWGQTVVKAGVAAVAASLTEAVLTGGNDNVVVPVVLWLCVKGLDL